MNFFQRFEGIFFSPQLTLKGISEKPVWVDALIFLLVILFIISYIRAPYQQKDTIQFMKSNVKLQERMGEENFKRAIERLENPSKIGQIIQHLLITPTSLTLGFLLSSLIILGLGRLTSTEGKYIQVFSAYIHANFIDKILGNAVRLILIFTRKSVMQTSTSLALFFPNLEVTSPAYVILSQFDFFQIWLFGILGYGLCYIFKIEFKKALYVSYGFWVLKSLLNVIIGLAFMQFMR